MDNEQGFSKEFEDKLIAFLKENLSVDLIIGANNYGNKSPDMVEVKIKNEVITTMYL